MSNPPSLSIVGTPQAIQRSLSATVSSLALPVGWVPGNVAVIWTGCHKGGAVLTMPAGWGYTPNSPTVIASCISRVLQAGDVPPACTWPGATNVYAGLVVLAGDIPTDLSQLFNAADCKYRQSSSTSLIPFPSDTISGPDEFLLACGIKWKTATANGATVANFSGFTPVVAASVPSGADIISTINYQQQTTATAIPLGGQTVNIADTSDFCAGYILAFNTQAAAAAGFTVQPSVTNRTAIPTGAFTIGFTPNASGTIYAVAVPVDSAAPSIAQIKAGQDGSGAAALAAANKAVTGVNTLTLGGALTHALVDIYIVLHTTVDSTVVALLAQFLLPTSGQQFVVVSSLPSGGEDWIGAGASPAVAAGDIIECDLVVSPDGYSLLMGGNGVPQFQAAAVATESFTVRLFQRSSRTWSARVTNYVNNFAPAFNGIDPVSCNTQAPISPVDLTQAFRDQNIGQGLTVTEVSGVPPGMSVVGNQLVGQPTTPGTYTPTILGVDAASDSAEGQFTVNVQTGLAPLPPIDATGSGGAVGIGFPGVEL